LKKATGQINALCNRRCFCLLLLLAAAAASSHAQVATPQPSPPVEQSAVSPATTRAPQAISTTRYQIKLQLDFDGRSYTGTERVRWTNRDNRPASALYFHLYANLRMPAQRNAPSSASAPDEPRLDISEVRAVATGAPLPFSLDEQATLLRVNLREALLPNTSTEIELKFKGSVPEIDPEETGLFVHVLQQVGAALRSEREVRRARDINFRCRGVMLLGAGYPVLAVRDGEDWQRKVETTVGDMIFAETAHYEVSIEAPSDVSVFTPTPALKSSKSVREDYSTHEFAGENYRDFSIVAGRALRSAERTVGDTTVRSIFTAEHEAIGRRVLNAGVKAAQVYNERFGALPFKTISIVDAPLVAGLGSAEFSGLGVIASAFYVDFDSPLMRNLPEIVREQRASLEDSLEFTVAHVVAQQWWGVTVGNDPERNPVLDEALANWSALLYYKEVHSEERALAAQDDQLRGVYKIYRTFGGEDMPATRAAREYRNFFQYAAIVSSKGSLMFVALRRLMGDEKFFAALRSYYETNKFEVAELDDLRAAFLAEAPREQRRAMTRIFNRWLSGKSGDEDIAPPDPQLALALGINPNATKGNPNAFARLGRFFWQQMTRIR
jgi:hypothetical protein